MPLQGHLVGVFGVPDMGPACSDKHVPNYLQNVGFQCYSFAMSKLLSPHMSCSLTADFTASTACYKGGFSTVQVDKLEEAGVKKVVCLAVAEPEEVSKWADKVGLTGSKIEVWADTKGAWTRMLGLDENQFDAPGPRSQRYKMPGLQYIHGY